MSLDDRRRDGKPTVEAAKSILAAASAEDCIGPTPTARQGA